MPIYYATVGVSHPLHPHHVRIDAADMSQAHEAMNETLGGLWAFLYENLPDLCAGPCAFTLRKSIHGNWTAEFEQ